MPMFVVLGHISDSGSKDMKNFLVGLQQNVSRAESMGIKLHGWYMTQGQYDFVVVAEAPDEATMLRQSFGVAGSGMARTETMRAYTVDEVRQLVQ